MSLSDASSLALLLPFKPLVQTLGLRGVTHAPDPLSLGKGRAAAPPRWDCSHQVNRIRPDPVQRSRGSVSNGIERFRLQAKF